tara:strand:- start:873 stop:1607 length:735 start_codon:yes stop_codon:yes gene_type:complete
MKNTIQVVYVVLLSFLSFNLIAQTPVNATVYDCNNVSKNIQNTLGTGKSVVVLSKGFDCSICISAAPAWQTFAAQNTSSVEVWGAMTFTYSMSIPTCSNITTWRNTHSWNNIFMFIDSTEQWYLRGTPRYVVYSAIDSTIVYDGRNPTTARNVALNNSLVTSITSYESINEIKIKSTPGGVKIMNLPSDLTQIDLIELSGRTIKSLPIDATQIDISFPNISGIYLLKFTNSKNQVGTKKIYFLK